MPKNVKILENTAEKILPEVGKIQTQLTNGSKCYWVPEDEIPLGTLTVTQDGVYKASEDPNGPYYGYSQVTASGIGSVEMGNLTELVATENGVYKASHEEGGPFVGYSKVIINVPQDGSYHRSSGTVGKDDDGDDAIATVDPETGEIKIDKLENGLPVRIEVIIPPDITTYNDGDTIIFDGLVVTAYCENDVPFDTSTTPNGVIPIEQLEFPVTVANVNDVSESTASSPLIPEPFEFGSKGLIVAKHKENPELEEWITYNADALTLAWPVSMTTAGVAASAEPGQSYTEHVSYPDGTSRDDSGPLRLSYTYDNKTVYYTGWWTTGWGYYIYAVDSVSPDGTDLYNRNDPRFIAWTMIYGTITPGGQTIPVCWKAPGSAGNLETYFYINVLPLPPSPSGTND